MQGILFREFFQIIICPDINPKDKFKFIAYLCASK